MKYWEKTGSRRKKAKEIKITKDMVKNTLSYIKRGHLPDWNYETHMEDSKPASLPNESYLLHIAMAAAIKAVDMQSDAFFDNLSKEISC